MNKYRQLNDSKYYLPCSDFKQKFCWLWHKDGHFTQEELNQARTEAQRLEEYFKLEQYFKFHIKDPEHDDICSCGCEAAFQCGKPECPHEKIWGIIRRA